MWQNVLTELGKLVSDPRLVTIMALIGADLLAGVGAAIHNKIFDWRRVADFYASNVIPYVLGYLAVVLVARFAVADLLGDYGYIAASGFEWAAWLTIIASLVGSIVGNLKEIGMGVGDETTT